MIKQLILLIQVLGLFFYQLIFTGDLTVTQKVPDSLTQGTETLIEIIVNKGDVTGFAKVQQVFPEGFTIEPVDTKGATFSFKDNKVKFIWMSLPSEKEFTISYKVTPNESTLGDFTLGGKFSFISESERKNLAIPVVNFSVVSESIVSTSEENNDSNNEETIDNEEPVVTTTEVEDEPIEVLTIVEDEYTEIENATSEEENVIEIVTINCDRIIEDLGNGKYKVSITINKKGIQGFAKITEQIPNGFVATDNDPSGGVFSFRENEVKILWMAIPSKDSYTVVYSLESISAKNDTYTIKGFYAYLKDDVTSKYTIDGSSFELNVETLIVEETEIETHEVEVPVIEEEPIVETLVIEEELEVPEPATSDDVTSTPAPENGVNYKVQVGAGHSKVSNNYFATKFNLQDNVSTINHEGWIKYLVGSFGEYKSARDKRNTVRSNVKTAFVTAYNSGTRITVQEALMISNQKWFK